MSCTAGGGGLPVARRAGFRPVSPLAGPGPALPQWPASDRDRDPLRLGCRSTPSLLLVPVLVKVHQEGQESHGHEVTPEATRLGQPWAFKFVTVLRA